MQPSQDAASRRKPVRPTVSAVFGPGHLAELVYDDEARSTALAVWDGKDAKIRASITTPDGDRLVPYAADNDLLRHGVIRFAQKPEEYGSTEELMAQLRAYLHRYVDLSEPFERLAACYALFTWVYDRFAELPYLRLRGDYGSGKTRFLLTLGAICYKPIFAGGASTTSPIFHMLNEFGGTLLVDEADFRFSDEKAQIAKILNNGNVRGFPVLRSESPNGKEFRPKAYQVFGPKIVGMRGRYEDRALESRFLTEESSGRALRSDIPINLPASQEGEALDLRNKLLMYRFRNFAHVGDCVGHIDPKLEPRLNQIVAPLLSIIEDKDAADGLRAYARAYQRQLRDERGDSMEAQTLAVIRLLLQDHGPLPVKDIADAVSRIEGEIEPISPRKMGHVLRNKLGLAPTKSHGVYVLKRGERAKLEALCARFDIGEADIARIAKTLGRPVPSSWVDFGDDESLPAII